MAELNFHHLRYFHTVAHEGNLTRAAQRLNVSQSAVSTQIRQLEDRLGHALFERRGRVLVLTEEGRVTLDYADSIFATGQELLATLSHGTHHRRGLRVGSLATLSRNFQLAFLRPLLGRADVEIIVRSGSAGELYSALAALQLDVVLTNQPPPHDALTVFRTRRLDEQPISLIGVPALCPPHGSLVERLQEAPLILPVTASALRSGIDLLINRLGISVQIAAEVDDMAMLRLLAREGAGLAVLPPIVVRDELSSGVLIESARLPDISETFYGVTVDRRFPNPLLDGLFATTA
ncbi:LysR family transcriptional regulator [Erythrobacter sp. SDW2]|uniref:LysR family transcriptional regulator n=1 Tax=Erythrobacter sp. SDW2 TaxID=2907154 RepID=UPI001F22AFA7|nr:LysR family transcriptional regulator [Erythrobacter sp. SDW2]UIP06768.1 LysR family transcriptional regulator [Erythrobacter sp. SDW2]